ncbi:MAG: hypothetical protein ABF449_05495, partial [Ethanoligenens sp.]
MENMKKKMIPVILLLLVLAVALSGCNPSPAYRKISDTNGKSTTATLDPQRGEVNKDHSADTGAENTKAPVEKQQVKDTATSSAAPTKAIIGIGGIGVGTQSGGSNAGISLAPVGGGSGTGTAQSGNGEGDSSVPSEEPSSSSPSSDDGGPMVDILDANGAQVPVPQNVRTIAATGGAAEMVEMLKSAKQSLVATSSAQKTGLFHTLFSTKDAGLANAVTLDNDEYDTLLNASTKPNVMFYTSGTLNTNQAAALRNEKIYPVALYDFSGWTIKSSDTAESALDELETNAKIVASVLGGNDTP